MRAAVVAGHAGDRRYQHTVSILVHSKKFLVDPGGHLVHVAGNILFRFGVAGEIEVMAGAIGGRRVAEAAFDAQGILKCVHRLIQVIVADVFRKHFEISFGRLVVGGAHGGDTDQRQGRQDGDNCNFLGMQHMGKFWFLKLGN